MQKLPKHILEPLDITALQNLYLDYDILDKPTAKKAMKLLKDARLDPTKMLISSMKNLYNYFLTVSILSNMETKNRRPLNLFADNFKIELINCKAMSMMKLKVAKSQKFFSIFVTFIFKKNA